MKRLVVVLLGVAIIVGGCIFFETRPTDVKVFSTIKTGNTVNRNLSIANNIPDSDILKMANGSGEYNFTKVLNKEISGDILSTELENSLNNSVYIADFTIYNESISLNGPVIRITNDVSSKPVNRVLNNGVISSSVNKKETIKASIELKKKNVTPKKIIDNTQAVQTINTVERQGNSITFNSTSPSNSKSNISVSKKKIKSEKKKCIAKEKNSEVVKNGNEAISLVINYCKTKYKDFNSKDLQTSVIDNQSIGNKTGYLVQVYNYVNNHDSTIGLFLVSKNGAIYNANTESLKKLN